MKKIYGVSLLKKIFFPIFYQKREDFFPPTLFLLFKPT